MAEGLERGRESGERGSSTSSLAETAVRTRGEAGANAREREALGGTAVSGARATEAKATVPGLAATVVSARATEVKATVPGLAATVVSARATEAKASVVSGARAPEVKAPEATVPGLVATVVSGARAPEVAGEGLDATKVTGSTTWNSAATRASARGVGEAIEVVRGTLLGRYVALDRLGAGAMGVVYAAFDPELDRKVAIKLLRIEGPGAGPDGRARLVREAQALAKLSHPNVVAIYDVGMHGEAVWIAMELVEGRTLREWLAERPREWREVLAVMRSAGLGLAAAHAVGLVHRDVKPDNLMITGDGRVRMMDFGLARGEGPREDREGFGRGVLSIEVTQIGSLVGTPAYMASEQLRGEHAGPPADVFAFCVMLWEGLHGARPFAGETLDELRANVAAGKMMAPPRGAKVPRWLDEVLTRGLAADPRRRWPGMAALLAALETGQTRGRRRRVLGALAGALVGVTAVGVGSAAWQRAEHEARVAACVGLGDEIAAVWDDAARGRLQAAFAAGGSAAAGMAERTLPWLDAWAADWRRVRIDTCSRHEVEEVWSAGLRARADECLDEQRIGFEALLGVLSDGDGLMRAVEAAAGLPSTHTCGDGEALERRPARPADGLVGLGDLRTRLARVAALELAGKYREGLVSAHETLAAAEAAGWAPAVAEARMLVGRLQAETGAFAEAAGTIEEAYFAAERASAGTVAVDAATRLSGLVGIRLGRRADGLRWARLAELGLMRLGSAGRTQRDALLLRSRGGLRAKDGDFAGAIADLSAAREIAVELLGPEHPLVVELASDVAIWTHRIGEMRLGEHSPKVEAMQAAVEAQERAFGPDHPNVGALRNDLGTALAQAGEIERALEQYALSMEIRTRAYGPEHPDVADSIFNMASTRFLKGEVEEAEVSLRQALAIYERAYGTEHAALVEVLRNLAFVQDARGDYAAAKATIQRAIDLGRRTHGEGHADLAIFTAILAMIHRHTGELETSWDLYNRALAIREKALPADHIEIVGNHRNLALVAALRGDAATARGHFARVESRLPPGELAETRFAIARAWWEASPGERAEARAFAVKAREEYAGREKELAAVDAWLASHPP